MRWCIRQGFFCIRKHEENNGAIFPLYELNLTQITRLFKENLATYKGKIAS